MVCALALILILNCLLLAIKRELRENFPRLALIMPIHERMNESTSRILLYRTDRIANFFHLRATSDTQRNLNRGKKWN